VRGVWIGSSPSVLHRRKGCHSRLGRREHHPRIGFGIGRCIHPPRRGTMDRPPHRLTRHAPRRISWCGLSASGGSSVTPRAFESGQSSTFHHADHAPQKRGAPPKADPAHHDV